MFIDLTSPHYVGSDERTIKFAVFKFKLLSARPNRRVGRHGSINMALLTE